MLFPKANAKTISLGLTKTEAGRRLGWRRWWSPQILPSSDWSTIGLEKTRRFAKVHHRRKFPCATPVYCDDRLGLLLI